MLVGADAAGRRRGTTRAIGLHVEKTIAIFRAGQKAGVVPAKNAIAVAGYQAVFPVAKGSGHDRQEESENFPDASQLLQYE